MHFIFCTLHLIVFKSYKIHVFMKHILHHVEYNIAQQSFLEYPIYMRISRYRKKIMRNIPTVYRDMAIAAPYNR